MDSSTISILRGYFAWADAEAAACRAEHALRVARATAPTEVAAAEAAAAAAKEAAHAAESAAASIWSRR